MKLLRIIGMALLAPLLSAQTADMKSILATSRQQVESADFSATGHLVWVQPSGARISYPITIKGRWFPGVLRIKAELGNGSKPAQGQAAAFHMPAHALIEMRPDGENAIWIAHPGDKAPAELPFDKWNDGPLGSAFSYEDLLEEQIFWPGQTLVEETKFGARDCVVVKSTPGAADKTHYAGVKTWFDRTIVFPVYIEKTVKETGTVKEFTSYGVRHEGGMWSAHQIEMKMRGQAGSTLLVLDRGTPKANLTLNDFSPAQLTHF
jgi:outer membrane lipoprotein-sorting protein